MKRSIALFLCATLAAPPADACTVFLIARDGRVLAGNNEDWIDQNTWIEFIVEEEARHYGRVYLGFDRGAFQGGMNEKGLFFDGLALEGQPDPLPPNREQFDGEVIDEALKTCASVYDVMDFFEQYDLGNGSAQLFFADARGRSVIVERGVMHEKNGDFQVVTNFRLSRQTPEQSGCHRYAGARRVLEECGTATVAAARDALHAAQQEITVYSNVHDLMNGDVHLWLNHDFETSVHFNLHAELEQGNRRMKLPEFFALKLAEAEAAEAGD